MSDQTWERFEKESDNMIEAMCITMHDAYEAAAVEEGWQTQARSAVPWSEVPEANKRTMRKAVRALLLWKAQCEVEWWGDDMPEVPVVVEAEIPHPLNFPPGP